MFSLISGAFYKMFPEQEEKAKASPEEMNLYSLGPLRVDRIDVIKAIARFKIDYPQTWQRASEMFNWNSDERAVNYIHIQLLGGCCVGTVSALFDKIISGKCRSIEEAAHDLQPEDVFYAQIISHFRVHIDSLSSNYDVNQYWLETKRQKLNFHADTVPNFPSTSRYFFPDSLATCQQVFEQTIMKNLQCNNTEDFAGIVNLRGHVFGFQYGPRGYFLWDTPNIQCQNLYRFSNSDAFFKELASLAQYHCTQLNCEMSYDIRPLNHINPLLPPLQNASEAKEEEPAASASDRYIWADY